MSTTNATSGQPGNLPGPYGFLDNRQSWTREIAQAIARRDGLAELTDPGEEARACM